MCDYCEEGIPLTIAYLDVGAFSESVEAYVDDLSCHIAIEKYDGDLRIRAHFCPMCGNYCDNIPSDVEPDEWCDKQNPDYAEIFATEKNWCQPDYMRKEGGDATR